MQYNCAKYRYSVLQIFSHIQSFIHARFAVQLYLDSTAQAVKFF